MTDLLQRALGSSVTIETRFALGTSAVFADVNQLEMALLNLVVNARDAMPSGGQIVISAREQTVQHPDGLKPGRYVTLSVQDSGIGMDEATLARAAEPFFTTKDTGKGTGLGLSVVHGLAEQSGGKFVLQSKLGSGTTAEVWLPIASGKENIKEELQSVTVSSPQRLVILTVDDDPLVLTNTVAMLEDLGHLPVAASSAAEAISIAKEDRPIDLVISDHIMPHMTGLKMLEEIRKMRPEIPVVLATGYAEIDERNVSLPRLAKPFTQAQLVQTIAHVLPPDVTKGRVIRFPAQNGNWQ
jgi:CheY-like chemotaxis protein/anti-sigma regulatory factor (Ser/Thr protein kinase)